jgi:hypothetical protein
MGVARLLARGWAAFCLYAAALALHRSLGGGAPVPEVLRQIGVCAALFGAVGLLFVAGYGLSAGLAGPVSLSRLKPTHFMPGFNELVFVAFALTMLYVQIGFAPTHPQGVAFDALKGAIRFGVFGQRGLEDALTLCGADGGRVLTSAVSWTLTFIFLGSALSRIRLAAGIVRLERKARPEALGPQALALLLGFAAVAGFQFLYIGTAFKLLPCFAYSSIGGDVLIGMGPLALAYLCEAALTNLLALNPDA